MPSAVLYIFSGLPGVGKTTLTQRLAGRLGCAYVRIDTVEQVLRDLCRISVEAEGYQLGYRLAADNLKVGMSVVADSCNPVEVTRGEWQDVARNQGADFVNIEVFCSDEAEHRRRVETRWGDIPGLTPPSWPEVKNRDYEMWHGDRVTIDTFGRTVDESLEELLGVLHGRRMAKADAASKNDD